MTVSTTTNKVRTNGDGATVNFSFSFRVLNQSDLLVYLVDANDVKTLQTISSDYTVSINDNGVGGTVTFLSAPAGTEDVLIVRELDFTQTTDLPVAGNLPEVTLENAYDKLTLLAQQLDERVDRSAKIDVAVEGVSDVTLPAPIDGYGLVWDGTDGTMANTTTAIADIVTDAQAAQTAAEAAQSAAETAQTNAETAETNAEASEAAAAISEANALAYSNSTVFRDVAYITSGDSPVTVGTSDNGKLYNIDSSGGAITFNLPEISGETLPFNISFYLQTSGNTVTINRGGASDTINGLTSQTLTLANSGFHLVADTDSTPDDWTKLDFGNLGAVNLEISSQSDNYTVLTTDDVVNVDCTSDDYTETLPSVSGISGKKVIIKRDDDGFFKKSKDFTDGDVTIGTDNINITSHGYPDLRKVQVSNSGGALPTGLSASTNYWVILIDDDNFKLASSLANAIADTAVDITAAAGGGTHTITSERTTLTIDGDGSELVGDATTKTLASENESITLIASSSGWIIENRYIPKAVIDGGPSEIFATLTDPEKATAVNTDKFEFYRDGEYFVGTWFFQSGSATGSSAGSGQYGVRMPFGLTFQSSVLTDNSASNVIIGDVLGAGALANGSSSTIGYSYAFEGDAFSLSTTNSATGGKWDASFFSLIGNNNYFSATIKVLIEGWQL